MAIVENWEYTPLAMEDDPDDYRPDSKLALIIDPAKSPEGFVQGLTVFDERIAPGDRIPLHQHTIVAARRARRNGLRLLGLFRPVRGHTNVRRRTAGGMMSSAILPP
jgi:hypothetical protein